MSTANKILMGASGAGGPVGPSDDEFNRVSFLSHFDGSNDGVNNQFTDGSASNHTITANGNVTQGSFGPFARPDGEWGVSFDGSGDYVAAATSTDWQFGSGNFTVEFWTYPLATGNWVIAHGDGSIAGSSISWQYGHGTFDFYYGSSYVQITSPTLTLNTWQHIAVVRNGATITVYKDGTSTGTANIGSNTLNTGGTTPFYIGGYPVAGGAGINGVISNVRVVKGTAVYTSNFTPSTDKLTAITNTVLLTCQSNRFLDNSSSGHTITPYGNAAVSAFGPFLTSSVYDPAVNGASAYMDGDGDYLSFPDSADWDFGTGDFTVEGWVNPASDLASDTQFIGFGDGDNGGNFGFEGTGQPYFYHGGYYARTSTALNLGSWSHIAFVRSSGTLSCYINGTSAASSSYTGNVGGSLAPRVGAYSGGQYFKGYMQDVRILKGTAVYTSNFTPPTAPLTAITNTKLLLNMADGQAIDSAAQNNLTLFGTAKLSTAQKKFGTASLLLDGNSDYVAIPAINLTNSFTMEFFAYLNAWPNSSNFDMFYGEESSIYMCFTSGINGIGSDRSIQLAYEPSGYSTIVQFNVNSAMNSGAWHHVAITKNSSNLNVCYIDGTAVPATNATGANTFSTTGTHFIGRGYNPSYHYFGGYIDDFRISQLVRYTSNFTPPTKAFADKGQ